MKWTTVTNRLAALTTVIAAVLISPALAAPALALDPTKSIIDMMPQCGLNCLLEMLPQTSCVNLSNETCICNEIFATSMQVCLHMRCDFAVLEDLRIIRQFNTRCKKPIPSRLPHIRAACVTMTFIVLAAIIVRLYARWEQRIFHGDDALIIFLLINVIPYSVLIFVNKEFGKNIWDLEPARVTFALKAFFIGSVFYCTIIAVSKLSMLLFYIRIFPSRTFKNLSRLLFAFILLSFLILVPIGLCQCLPVPFNWEGWKGEWKGEFRCMDPHKLALEHSVLNTVQEFMVLVLPLPYVFRLKIGWKKKVGLVTLFSVGIFTCVVSIVRVVIIKGYVRGLNPTWNYSETYLWSTLEVYMNSLIPNLLGIFSLLSRKFPKFFGHDDDKTNQQNRHKQNSFFRIRAMREEQQGENEEVIGQNRSGSCTLSSTVFESEEAIEEEIGSKESTTHIGRDIEKGLVGEVSAVV